MTIRDKLLDRIDHRWWTNEELAERFNTTEEELRPHLRALCREGLICSDSILTNLRGSGSRVFMFKRASHD